MKTPNRLCFCLAILTVATAACAPSRPTLPAGPGTPWPDFAPALEWVLECFGPRRLMFGSDWPVCTVSAPYDEVLGIVTEFVSTLSPEEQAAILGETAREFYGIR